MPEGYDRYRAWGLSLATESPGALLGGCEDAEYPSDALQFSRRVVAEQPGERDIGSEGSAITAEEAESYRGPVGQGTKAGFRFPERLFHPTARDHRFFEIQNLLAEAGDLVDEVMLRAVVVSHLPHKDGRGRSVCTGETE